LRKKKHVKKTEPISIASVPYSILTIAILLTPFFFHCTLLGAKFSVVDPHHINADADPDPGCQNDPDPDPQHWKNINIQNFRTGTVHKKT
jgi:hypothetical protein